MILNVSSTQLWTPCIQSGKKNAKGNLGSNIDLPTQVFVDTLSVCKPVASIPKFVNMFRISSYIAFASYLSFW